MDPRCLTRSFDAPARRRAHQADGGSAMLEVVIAMTLMGIAFAAIFGALSTASIATLRNNQQVQVEVALAQGKATLQSAAFDATGHSDRAVPLYREALERGLSGERRRRARG